MKEEVVTVKLTFGNCNLNSSSMKYLTLLILMYSVNVYSQNTNSILYAKPKKYFVLLTKGDGHSSLDNYLNTKKFKKTGDTLSFEIVSYGREGFEENYESKCLISNAYIVRKEDNIAVQSVGAEEIYQKIISIYKQTLKKKK